METRELNRPSREGGLDPEDATQVAASVRERYSAGAQVREDELCCPVEYDPEKLAVLPAEIVERDYGCGDPSRFVREGEVVLDLGSGAGKICYLAAQVVGPEGRVVGVDMTPDMLELARRYRGEVAARIGWDVVEFHRGRIEDLALDLDRLDAWLAEHPVRTVEDLEALEAEKERLRREEPMVADESVDVVLSNCVLNLVAPGLKPRLFREVHRVLKRGGRAVISDIVADREVPEALQRDPELWSGCISGALEERAFLRAFEDAGFHGITVLARQAEPWKVVDGIEFRSVTVAAWKGTDGPCPDSGRSVIYLGPFREVHDDDGHVFVRGERTPVCDETADLLGREPYSGAFAVLAPSGRAEEDGSSCCAPSLESASSSRAPSEEPSSSSCCAPKEGGGSCC